MLYSYKATIYTIFKFNLSFQLWASANNELSRPDRRNLCSITSDSCNCRIQSQRRLTLETERRWCQIDLMGRDAEVTVRKVSHFPTETPGEGPVHWREYIDSLSRFTFTLQILTAWTWRGLNHSTFSLIAGRSKR